MLMVPTRRQPARKLAVDLGVRPLGPLSFWRFAPIEGGLAV